VDFGINPSNDSVKVDAKEVKLEGPAACPSPKSEFRLHHELMKRRNLMIQNITLPNDVAMRHPTSCFFELTPYNY
jgi:hypothetical protein